MAIYLAQRIHQWGYRVAVISRGYQGKAETCGGMVSDMSRVWMDAAIAGDEPFLMASTLKGIPVLVGKDRYRSGLMAIQRFRSDVLILDDAFQHLDLHRNLDLVLLDSTAPFVNGHIIPRGMLREPISALHDCDAVVITRSGEQTTLSGSQFLDKPIFSACHEPYLFCRCAAGQPVSVIHHDTGADSIKGKCVFAFSGIAHNDEFFNSVRQMGASIVGFQEFDDHHPYSLYDIRNIVCAAEASKAALLVTTQKDAARLHGRFHFPFELAVIAIHLKMVDDRHFLRFIQERLSSARTSML